jgi:hypothetical protein
VEGVLQGAVRRQADAGAVRGPQEEAMKLELCNKLESSYHAIVSFQ